MDNKSKFWGIIAIVAVVLVVGIYFIGFSSPLFDSNTSDSNNIESDQEGANPDSAVNSEEDGEDGSDPDSSPDGDEQNEPEIISTAEARNIVQKYLNDIGMGDFRIGEGNLKTGTWNSWKGREEPDRLVYEFPISKPGEKYYVVVDAQSGRVLDLH